MPMCSMVLPRCGCNACARISRRSPNAFWPKRCACATRSTALDAALAQSRSPAQSDIDVIAAIHAVCLSRGRLTTRDGGFGWTWDIDDAPDQTLLGPIAASAMMLITTADRARLKQCGGHHCGWLFLDTTKSNNRRWCEMEVCGNRAKQKRRRGP